MKLYKDPAGAVFAYELDGSQDSIIPADQVPITQAEADALRAPPPPTADQLKAFGEAAIQNLLDSTAQAHGYDSLERCISYIGDAVAFWNSEGTRAKAWRSECWSKAKQIQDDATAGNWPTVGAGQIPSKDDVLAAMPPANWPTA